MDTKIMANYLKISTIGPAGHSLPKYSVPGRCVEEMIGFWEKQFSQVLYDNPDLIVVPEVCDIPVDIPGSMAAEYCSIRGNKVFDYFCYIAKENRCNIVYASNVYDKHDVLRNTAVMIGRNGEEIGRYNKNHLVPEENDIEGIAYGTAAPLVECDFGRVAFTICFDLNFDELRLKYANAHPDLIVFPSLYHGGLMQAYWAYSCRCHFVGAVAGLACEIRNPYGGVIASSTNYRNFTTAVVNLDCGLVKRDLDEKRYAEIKKKYGSEITIDIPPELGIALISSETDKITTREIMQEFKISSLDEFFKRALIHRQQNLEHNLKYKENL